MENKIIKIFNYISTIAFIVSVSCFAISFLVAVVSPFLGVSLDVMNNIFNSFKAAGGVSFVLFVVCGISFFCVKEKQSNKGGF